jgi:phospholipase/lecithinase/hemolysin
MLVMGTSQIEIKQENKMSKKNQHVVPHGNDWAVKGAGNSKATAVHPTQQEAIKHAREIAQNQKSELLIHGQNGRIREKNSYGNDQFPPKG